VAAQHASVLNTRNKVVIQRFEQTISDIALARSDHDAARKRYEEALEILLFSYVLGRKMMRQVLI
jgi:hypothetical protein